MTRREAGFVRSPNNVNMLYLHSVQAAACLCCREHGGRVLCHSRERTASAGLGGALARLLSGESHFVMLMLLSPCLLQAARASIVMHVLQGWRFAFYAVAVMSAAAAAAILALGTDPAPRRPAAASGKVLRLSCVFRLCPYNATVFF